MSESFYDRRTVYRKPPEKHVSRKSSVALWVIGLVVVLAPLGHPDVRRRLIAFLPEGVFQAKEPLRMTETELADFVITASKDHGVPAGLIWAIISIESDFRTRAVSHRGAMGLMQLTDETARRMNVVNPYDPAENINGGAKYIADLLKRYKGRTDLALAAYNAGPEAVKKYRGIPPFPETRSYVMKVLDEFKKRTKKT